MTALIELSTNGSNADDEDQLPHFDLSLMRRHDGLNRPMASNDFLWRHDVHDPAMGGMTA